MRSLRKQAGRGHAKPLGDLGEPLPSPARPGAGLQRPPVVVFHLLGFALVLAQQGQVAQLLGHVWMKLAQDLGPEEPVAGLGASLGAPSPPGRPCPACSHLLPDLQRPLAQRLSLLVLAPLAIQDRQIIQCCSHLEGGERRLCDLGPAGTWELQGAGEEASLTAGWSLPRVFSRMARASLSRWAASLYLFWSLGTGAS